MLEEMEKGPFWQALNSARGAQQIESWNIDIVIVLTEWQLSRMRAIMAIVRSFRLLEFAGRWREYTVTICRFFSLLLFSRICIPSLAPHGSKKNKLN